MFGDLVDFVLILLSQCYLLQVTKEEVLGKFSQDFVLFFKAVDLEPLKVIIEVIPNYS